MYLHHLIDQKMHLHFFTRFLFWWKKVSQATFQRCFNVVGLIWRRNVGQSQIKVETTRCMSTLKLATLNIVESTLSISTLILANNLWLCQNNIVTFNVEFQNVDQHRNTVVNMTFKKRNWNRIRTLNLKLILLFQNLVDFIPDFKSNMEKNICKPEKIRIISWKCWITRAAFIPPHFVNYW